MYALTILAQVVQRDVARVLQLEATKVCVTDDIALCLQRAEGCKGGAQGIQCHWCRHCCWGGHWVCDACNRGGLLGMNLLSRRRVTSTQQGHGARGVGYNNLVVWRRQLEHEGKCPDPNQERGVLHQVEHAVFKG